MSYQVLARKWRPKKFSDVIGQQHILTALANSLSSGMIHHAYLFSGTRGVGKTTIARLLSKGLTCEMGMTAIPCGHCRNCREIDQGRFIDLIEIDAASRSKVEDTRELLENIQYAPTRGRFKIYLIDEIHMLSRYSFNTLLKTLEEPPIHVKFLLATTDPNKLPITILSRCLQFHLKPIDVTLICNKLSYILKTEEIDADPCALQRLARAAGGSMRDALNLTEQAIALDQNRISIEVINQMLGALNTKQSLEIIKAMVNADASIIMEHLAECASYDSIHWDNLLVEILSLLHRIAMKQLLPDQFNDDEENEEKDINPFLCELAQHILPSDLQLYYQTFLSGRQELPYAPNSRIGVEMTIFRALAFHSSSKALNTSTEFRSLLQRRCSPPPPPPPPLFDNIKNIIDDTFDIITDDQPYDDDDVEMKSILSMTCSSQSSVITDSDDDAMASSSSMENYNSPINENAMQQETHHPMMISSDPQSSSVTVIASVPDDPNQQLLHARTTLLQCRKDQKNKANLKLSSQRDNNIASVKKKDPTLDIHSNKKFPIVMNQTTSTLSSSLYERKKQDEEGMRRKHLKKQEEERSVRIMKEYLSMQDPRTRKIDRLLVSNPKNIPDSMKKKSLSLSSLLRSDLKSNPISDESSIGLSNLGIESPMVDFTVQKDDHLTEKTPIDLQVSPPSPDIDIEKLLQAKKSILSDTYIKMLQTVFDAELDEDSIKPM